MNYESSESLIAALCGNKSLAAEIFSGEIKISGSKKGQLVSRRTPDFFVDVISFPYLPRSIFSIITSQ
jgi:hypothetical protein